MGQVGSLVYCVVGVMVCGKVVVKWVFLGCNVCVQVCVWCVGVV